MKFKEHIRLVESLLIRKALIQAEGRISKAAKILGLHHGQLADMMKRRHADLQHLRIPPRKRKSHSTPHWEREAL